MKRTLGSSVALAVSSSALVASATMPTVIRRLKKFDQFDRPNARSSHVTPTPRGGGLACVAGIVAGVGVARAAGLPVSLTVTGGALVLASIGYIDDRVGLSASARLGAQLAVGAIGGAVLGKTLPAASAGAITIPAVVNSFNFMDGINGISAGEMVVWASSTIPYLVGVEVIDNLSLVASALGAGLSFLPWNVPVASVFLGDVGSYLFGSIIAFVSLSVVLREPSAVRIVSAPYLVYLADTGWTLVRRTRAGEKLTDAHRDHVYQAVSDLKGIEHWHVAAGVASISAISALLSRKFVTAVGIPPLLAIYLSSPSVIASFNR